MDFWSRLLGGTTSSRQSTSATPQQRLARFKRTYDQIRLTYQKSPLLQPDSAAAETIRTCFQRLTSTIQDEARAPAPHLCLQFASSAQIYSTISRIGAVAQHEGIIREAVGVFQALIESDEEEFLESERFAHALMVFVERTAGAGNMYVGEDTEGEIVELLFGIAAKIRLQPEILPVWFRDREQAANKMQSMEGSFVGVTSKADFPLCYQLIDYVHHEGRMGDFARTGLLYIFESASKSEELEKWIVASDMPTLMATGLGALYSQLSRKLSIVHPTEELPVILTLSDYAELKAPEEAEGLYTSNVQGHLSTFLSYLTFWQDVLEHCRSIDVRQTLLDHFQVLFLQQLLYPSMLESSDVDGGSSVAVLTFLRSILDALDHAELVNLVLQYLLALPEPKRARSPTALKRRSSLLLLTEPANEDDRMNPALFNLIDLLQNSVDSENPQTVISALKLATVVLGKNHVYAIDTLLKTQMPTDQDTRRTHGALNAEVEAYMALATSIGGASGLDEAYDSHVKDAMRLIESHACSNPLLDLGVVTGSTATKPLPNPVGRGRSVPHIVRKDDAFLNKMLKSLRSFLTNNVELNLALTEAFITLLTCPHFGLEGWTAVDPKHYQYSNSTTEEIKQHPAKSARRRPTWNAGDMPLLMQAIQELNNELDILKRQMTDLDGLIAARKQAFRLHAEIEEAIKSPPPLRIAREREGSTIASPSQQQSLTGPPASIQQRLLDAVSPSPSRSQSRGRRANVTSSPTPNTFLSQYAPGIASPTSLSTPSRSKQRSSGEAMARQSSDSGRPAMVGSSEQQLLADVMDAASEERMKMRIRFPLRAREEDQASPTAESYSPSGGASPKMEEVVQYDREASLGHILTNAVVLQEFVLEIMAVMQVRASMFDEIAFV